MANLHNTKAEYAEIIKKFGGSPLNTGSSEVQVALLTKRITELNDHFKDHPKDNHSKQGMLKLIGTRKRLLSYLRLSDHKRYSALIQSLNLRK